MIRQIKLKPVDSLLNKDEEKYLLELVRTSNESEAILKQKNIVLDKDSRLFYEKQKELGKEAIEVLLNFNKGLVFKFVNKYAWDGIEKDDLKQVGFQAFVNSVNSYNPNKGVKLSTYASQSIKRAILKEVNFQRNLVNIENRQFKYLEEMFGSEYAKNFGKRTSRREKHANWGKAIETLVYDAPNQSQIIKKNELIAFLFSGITTEEKLIVDLHLGFIDNEELSFAAIGKSGKLGRKLSRQRVKQIYDQTIEKMKKNYHQYYNIENKNRI